MNEYGLIALIAGFQCKHFLCDYLLQTERMLVEKGQYGRPAGIAHAAIHALLSLPLLWLAGAPLSWVLGLGVFELLLHYHIDWIKERVQPIACAKRSNQGYWVVVGLDQLAHQLTYLLFVIILLRVLGG